MRDKYYLLYRQWLNIMDQRLEKMLKESDSEKLCNENVARNLDLFFTYINGYGLIYMKSHQPYGVRCYRLDDNLAKVLGFSDIQRLRDVLPIRKSNRYISVDNLRRAINRYAMRSMGWQPISRNRKK